MNCAVECFYLTALDHIKALLNASGLPKKFWAKTLMCFSYVWNRVCHKQNTTSFEMYSDIKPSVSHLKKCDCLAYVGVPKQVRRKLHIRAKLGIMRGYD